MKILYFASSILLSAIAGFFIANLLDNSRYGEEIQFIQAEKIDADLASLKEVKNYLNAGCLGSARQQIDNKMDQDLMFLSEHVRLFPNGKYAARLKKDDPVLYGVIRDYGTDWKKLISWVHARTNWVRLPFSSPTLAVATSVAPTRAAMRAAC